jgi:hypothetical protein
MDSRIVATRLDAPPLCITHHVRMLEDCEEETQIEPDLQSNSYHCPSTDCDLNWERRLGYFKTATTKQTFQFGIEGRRCPTPGHFFLYLGELRDDGKTRLWRCSIQHCNHVNFEGRSKGS